MLSNIPPELQSLPQWVCAGPDKIPLNPRTGKAADPVDPSTWGTFNEAISCGYKHIGFCLHADDPYCVIDLDDAETIKVQGKEVPNPDRAKVEEIKARHELIYKLFDTYTELSQSGKGVHIVCRASVGAGKRRDKIEIYSQERYIIFTGNVLKAFPIADCQDLVTQLYAEMGAERGEEADLVDRDAALEDDQIYEMAAAAKNGQKFVSLWRGEWQGNPSYPSQSEADHALMSFLCFYSKSNEQCRRLFRMSELGKREKAQRDSYLNYTIGLFRAQELPPIDFSAILTPPKQTTPQPTNTNEHGPKRKPQVKPSRNGANEGGSERGNGGIQSQVSQRLPESGGADEHRAGEQEEEAGGETTVDAQPNARVDDVITYPPGLIGEMADYIYSSAIRPIPEAGLAASIALGAGVCGRAYNISNTGLNQYLVLLARTGSGKEGAATGIDALLTAVRPQCPSSDDFIGPGAFASGQALTRVLDKHPCFVSVLGEFGLTLHQICDPKANAAQVMLKKVLLDIYAKSGFRKTLRSSAYSDAEKNTKTIQAPNVTLFGESTPDTFYGGLNVAGIAEGLIPRFSIFDYTGKRPPENPNAFHPPSEELTNNLAELCAMALAAQANRSFMPVQIAPSAQKMFKDFNVYIDEQINAGSTEITLQLWNRAGLKAQKLAGLIAVGCNPHQPVVHNEAAEWAMRQVSRDVDKLLARFRAGDIGMGDSRMESDAKRAIQEYLGMSESQRRRYHVSKEMARLPKVIPWVYLRERLRNLQSFTSDRRGANMALQATMTALCDAGQLERISPVDAQKHVKTRTQLYCLGDHWAPLE